MNPKLKLIILSALSVGFAAKRLGIRASVYLLAYFTALNVFAQPINRAANIDLVTGGTYYSRTANGVVYLINDGSSKTASDNVLYSNVTGAIGIQVTGTGSALVGRNLAIYTGIKLDASGNALDSADHITSDPAKFVPLTTVYSNDGILVTNGAYLEADGLKIVTNGREANGANHGIRVSNSGTVKLSNVDITAASGDATYGMIVNSFSVADIRGGTIVSASYYAIGVDSHAVVTGSGLNLAGTTGVRADRGSAVTLTDSFIVGTGYVASGAAMITANNVRVIGTTGISLFNRHADETDGARVIINGGSLEVTGALITVSDSFEAPDFTEPHAVILNGAQVTNSGSILVRASGSQAALDVTFNDMTVNAGDVVGYGSSSVTMHLNDSALTGNVTGNDAAAVAVTLSGSDSTLLGDITQSGSSAVTVILNDSATGTGGYHGGNLITGGDSVWTFNQDSHGNYGENHGTWNLGDYEVIFDNMTHSGTVNISVNSDTGAGGSITVTGTADGEGIVHIDTTGNGQLNPNDVLPGIVSGDGTEHWQWDPIDWGIDTIIKDGNHFIKQGTSPAGAVLNSSVAIQQAMWFAQQNSLLKRMGELRYGARASRPLAGETPAFHIIENLWLRSYGQQLNIGSQVAGRAYEQLIYGVDLGTDHKFTLSADSDLYLGIYAGYGRSDIDYRTPGTDGELNSYYGGLYATWLHSSGFYIDATVKAASVDNNLKAPHGDTQLKANYSDINIGGSLELGKKFTFADAWFIEPQFQVNYLHILAE
ncbi:MAG: autotransporter outer membrane beta-barrel domain-containing protein, partial [Verrucomicrobiales bacterium]|nr:autotransporter outer membrane beta-barrel domain-containing protein [Verrucomicrobiales bacterium]